LETTNLSVKHAVFLLSTVSLCAPIGAAQNKITPFVNSTDEKSLAVIKKNLKET
jgi:hypothetical protein